MMRLQCGVRGWAAAWGEAQVRRRVLKGRNRGGGVEGHGRARGRRGGGVEGEGGIAWRGEGGGVSGSSTETGTTGEGSTQGVGVMTPSTDDSTRVQGQGGGGVKEHHQGQCSRGSKIFND